MSGPSSFKTGAEITGLLLEKDERWLLVQRIVASRHFAKASQLREILTYVTRQVVLSEGVAIPEYEIACKVLGRREGFNPNDDNIVRFQAGHLRRKLDQYFAMEGKGEPCILVIPKGTYVPQFVQRHGMPIAEESENTPIPHAVELVISDPAIHTSEPRLTVASPPERPSPQLQEPPRVRWYWIPAAFVLGISIMFWFYRSGSILHSSTPMRSPRNIIEQHIFASSSPLSIVIADTSLVLLQNTLKTDVSVGDYTSNQYPSNLLSHASDDAQRTVLEKATNGRYTSLGDLTTAMQCEELARQFGVQPAVKYARYMSVRDFEKGNFILIGSRRGNPWTALFEEQLNFSLQEDKETHSFHFLDKNPLPGEQPIYSNQTGPDGGFISYVDLALVPNLARTGYVLLFNGLVMDSTEAASQLIFDGHLPEQVQHAIDSKAAGNAQSIEIFLRVHSLERAPRKYDVVASRVDH